MYCNKLLLKKLQNLHIELRTFILTIYFPGPVVNLPHAKDIGFLAYPSAHYMTTANTKVRFDKVDRNDGQGYNVKTGIFTSPVAGMYHFFWNLLSADTREYTVDLVLNGNQKIRNHAASRQHVTPSGSVYLRLKVGDQVYLQAAHSGGKINSGRYSTFGGELIRY